MTLKTTLVALLLGTALNAGAAGIDLQAFGTSLNGWRKDRTALYSINNNTYRTHVPTVTMTTDGGMFVSTRIELANRFTRSGVTCFLETTFSPGGRLIGGQIRMTTEKHRLTTGLVKRRSERPVPLEEGEVDPNPDWNTPDTELVMDLFSRLDGELAKLSEDDKEGRKDVFGRLSGKGLDTADLAAALRHNLNLLLQCAGPGGGVIGKQ